MDILLNDIEVRVLGSLVEKELTTPEYYPLSLNSLTNACNQKSNRDPVLALTEDDVVRALDSLRFKQLAVTSADSGRVPKYRHLLAEKLGFVTAELAVLCELLVRGPQTAGELRTRCERMYHFSDAAVMDDVLKELAVRETPFIFLLPRQPGRKESRYTQLFSGMPEIEAITVTSAAEPARIRVNAENERIAALENEVVEIRSEIVELQRVIAEFRAQFE